MYCRGAPIHSSHSQRELLISTKDENVLHKHNWGSVRNTGWVGVSLAHYPSPSTAFRIHCYHMILKSNSDYPGAFMHQPLWHKGQIPGVLECVFGHMEWMASCRDNRNRTGEERWMMVTQSVTKRCWRLVAMRSTELALSLGRHLHHHSGDWATIIRERTTQAKKAGHPRHCPTTCQFSCNVWHSMLCLTDNHLCLVSLELSKHLLSFCSLTSVWSSWHHAVQAFCMIPSAARCSHTMWLSSS